MLDDKKLYQEFIEGNIESFEKLVINHKDNLIYFISRYTKDLYMAEDIAQDVFAHIYVYKEKYKFEYSFKTYIYTLGKNKAIDYVRKQTRLDMVSFNDSNDLLYSEENLEDKIIENEEKAHLINALKKLKPDYERAIYLVDFEELTYQEVSEILGKNLSQTKVLIHRARKALRKLLEEGADHYEK